MKRLRIKQISVLTIVFLLLLGALTLFNPKSLPLPLLMAPFLLLFALLFLSLRLIIPRLGVFTSRKQGLIVSGMLAVLPVLLLVFQSIHQLTLRDVLVSLALILIGAFYISRADFIH